MPDPISPTKSGGVAHYRDKSVTPNAPACGQIKADNDTWAGKLADITCPECIRVKGAAEHGAEPAAQPREASAAETKMLVGMVEAGLAKLTGRITYAYRKPPVPAEALHPVAVQTVVVLDHYNVAAVLDHPLVGLVVVIGAMGLTISQLPTINDDAELARLHGRPEPDAETDAAAA